MEKIQVLVVDDSALMRNLIGKIVDSAPDMEVAGKAMNGNFALQKIPLLKPDIIILDLEMPSMNGIEFLEAKRKQGIQIPVVILSSIAKKGAKITMDALSMGAADFLTKPSGSISTDIHLVAANLKAFIRAYGGKYAQSIGKQIIPPPADDDEQLTIDLQEQAEKSSGAAAETAEPKKAARPAAAPAIAPKALSSIQLSHNLPKLQAGATPQKIDIIAIGISTGGPNALRKMLAAIDHNLKLPIVIVQHMPAGFTFEFAKSLNRICPLEVKEAEDGDILQAGHVYIAPGDKHMEVRSGHGDGPGSIRLQSNEAENGHRPSADVLFRSIAKEYKNRCIAAIMTGMGRDGAREIGTLYSLGAITLGQDALSCVVYGMPKIAYEAGYLTKQISLARMSDTICEMAAKYQN